MQMFSKLLKGNLITVKTVNFMSCVVLITGLKK